MRWRPDADPRIAARRRATECSSGDSPTEGRERSTIQRPVGGRRCGCKRKRGVLIVRAEYVVARIVPALRWVSIWAMLINDYQDQARLFATEDAVRHIAPAAALVGGLWLAPIPQAY